MLYADLAAPPKRSEYDKCTSSLQSFDNVMSFSLLIIYHLFLKILRFL